MSYVILLFHNTIIFIDDDGSQRYFLLHYRHTSYYITDSFTPSMTDLLFLYIFNITFILKYNFENVAFAL